MRGGMLGRHTFSRKLGNPDFQMFDQWQVKKQAAIQNWADVYVHSRLPDEDIRKAMLKPACNILETLTLQDAAYGKEMSVAVLPQGSLTIPYVENE